jgi:hypothetical protein
VLVLLAPNCSLLLPAEPEVVYCADEGAIGLPACDPRHVCAAGRCQGCSAKEACGDHVDNDCNGEVDDRCPSGTGGAAGEPSR